MVSGVYGKRPVAWNRLMGFANAKFGEKHLHMIFLLVNNLFKANTPIAWNQGNWFAVPGSWVVSIWWLVERCSMGKYL